MMLPSNSSFGSYELLGLLGKGGMGEVYRARDLRLGRLVAIKMLPPQMAADRDRLRRFEQEARAASALSHPNIVVIHEVGQVDAVPYIAMELVEGHTLREALDAGPLPTARALRFAIQVASGLAKAHAAGIAHRDLKPENLMVTTDGLVKILDFGLAKLVEPDSPDGVQSQPATLTAVTERGAILGTVGYMSPEQASGQPSDYRSDQFSFGAILYEMITATRAFQRRTPVETMSAIIREDPKPIATLKPDVLPPLCWTIEHCLAKNPDERYAATADLARELQTIERHEHDPYTSSSLQEPAPLRRSWRKVLPFAAALMALVAGGLLVKYVQRELPRPKFEQVTFRRGAMSRARFAPDGDNLVYDAAWDGKPLEIFIGRSGSPESRPLGLQNACIMAISSKGEMAIGLGSSLNWGECHDATLARLSLAGGAPREILEHVDAADWSPDGNELAAIHIEKGRYRLEYPIGKLLYESPGWITYARVSPRGDLIAFLNHPVLGELGRSVEVVELSGKKRTVSTGWQGLIGLTWSATGDEVWFTGSRHSQTAGDIYAVDLTGHERLVFRTPRALKIQDVSRDGRRVLVMRVDPRGTIAGMTPGSVKERNLSWFDYSTAADLSADGKNLLFYEWGVGVGGTPTTYLRKTDGSDPVRLGQGRPLALSPTGDWVLALQTGSPQQLVLLPTGPGQPKPLPRGAIDEFYSGAWFPAGGRILFTGAEKGQLPRSYVQDIDGGMPRRATQEGVVSSVLSPDANWMVTFSSGGLSLCPLDGGDCKTNPGLLEDDTPLQWSVDGRSIYVRSFGDLVLRIYKVDVVSGHRELWRELAPLDPAGLVGIAGDPGQVRITPDGKFYVYTYWNAISDLFVAEQLR